MQNSWKNVKSNKFAAKFSKKTVFSTLHLNAGRNIQQLSTVGVVYMLISDSLDLAWVAWKV